MQKLILLQQGYFVPESFLKPLHFSSLLFYNFRERGWCSNFFDLCMRVVKLHLLMDGSMHALDRQPAILKLVQPMHAAGSSDIRHLILKAVEPLEFILRVLRFMIQFKYLI